MKTMMNKYIVGVLAATALLLGSCSEWTEAESMPLDVPTLEQQNPELYEQYLAAVRDYKMSEHQVMYLSFNNVDHTLSHRNQHLTTLPDSADFVMLKNPADLIAEYQNQMVQVREQKGTRFVYKISYDAIAAEWKAMIDAEIEALPEPAEGEEPQTVDESIERFTAFFQDHTQEQLSYCSKYGFDGIEFSYSGRSLLSLTEEALAEVTAQQQAFIGEISTWASSNASKLLFFSGQPQNLVDKSILQLCENIIIPVTTATNAGAISVAVLNTISEGVPTDRYLVAVSTPVLDDPTSMEGYFASYLEDGKTLQNAVCGAALWCVAGDGSYTRAGVAVDNAERDYFNPSNVYSRIKGGIEIMNP